MAGTTYGKFYGKWRVILVQADPPAGTFPEQGFGVIHSATSSSFYLITPGQPMQIDLEGEGGTCTLTIENQQFSDNGTVWVESEPVQRSMRLDPVYGLTVRLDSHRQAFGKLVGVTLDCVSQDPDLNPPLPPNPYDFTYKPM